MEVRVPKIESWYPEISAVNLEVYEASWLAALIDGEGSISIHRQARKQNASGYKYRPVVEISNTNMPILQKVASLIPGWISNQNRGRTLNLGHKPLYKFMASTKCMVELLDEVRPFLIIKHEQALIVKGMCELLRREPNRQAAANHEIFERMWLEMKALNTRGSPGA